MENQINQIYFRTNFSINKKVHKNYIFVLSVSRAREKLPPKVVLDFSVFTRDFALERFYTSLPTPLLRGEGREGVSFSSLFVDSKLIALLICISSIRNNLLLARNFFFFLSLDYLLSGHNSFNWKMQCEWNLWKDLG